MRPHTPPRLALIAGVLALAGAPTGAAGHGDEAHPKPAAAAAPRFEPPAPGSYELPAIDSVGAHQLIDPAGSSAPLLDLAPGEAALVSFVYLSCGEACPQATAVLSSLDRDLAERPELAARVELVTISFDPARDTPAAMGRYRRALSPRGRWRFLTAPDPAGIVPVLDDFGQDATVLRTAAGEDSGLLRHVLKVFLLDADGRIRNVYSTGFLDRRILLNDLITLTTQPAGH